MYVLKGGINLSLGYLPFITLHQKTKNMILSDHIFMNNL